MHELEMLDYLCKIVPDIVLLKVELVNHLKQITYLYNNPSQYTYVKGKFENCNSFEEYIYHYISFRLTIINIKARATRAKTIFGKTYEVSIAEPSRFNTLIHTYNLSSEHLLWLIEVCNKYEAYEQVAILEQRIAEIGGCKSLTDRFQL